jgi:hypothetical protein
MSPSSRSNLPLTPGPARKILAELFNEKPLWRTAALIERVPQKWRDRGGVLGKDTMKNVINKALGYLKRDGCIRRPAYGYWEWIGDGGPAGEDDLASAPPSSVPIEEKITIEQTLTEGPASVEKIKIEQTLGEGTESVYVYYYDTDRELANFKGQAAWPCKIGRAGEPVDRILNQTRTARHSLPVFALAIWSDDARGMEELIHQLLQRAGLSIDNDYCGDEWFMTNPEQIAACYSGIEDLVASLRRAKRTEKPGTI